MFPSSHKNHTHNNNNTQTTNQEGNDTTANSPVVQERFLQHIVTIPEETVLQSRQKALLETDGVVAFLLERQQQQQQQQQQQDPTTAMSLEQNMEATRAALCTACKDMATLQNELSSRIVWGRRGSSSAAQEQFLHDLELAAAAVRVILLDRTLSKSNNRNETKHKHKHLQDMLHPKQQESFMQTIRSTLPNLILFKEEEEQEQIMKGMSVESRWNQMGWGDRTNDDDDDALHVALRQWEQTDSSHTRRSRNILFTRIAVGIASTLFVVLAGASSTQ
jgi:hypothetical protein